VEVYESEREQIDAIKKWWKENGKAIVIGAVLGFGSLIGWQQWQANQHAKQEAASAEYDFLLTALDSNDVEAAKSRGSRILSEYGDTAYAPPAALAMAKLAVEAGDLDTARAHLQNVIDKADQAYLKKVAQLRMGRLLLAKGELDQAMSLVHSVNAAGFSASFSELEGDIQVAQGHRDLARQAYQRALDSLEQGMDAGLLKMKLDDVGGPEAKG